MGCDKQVIFLAVELCFDDQVVFRCLGHIAFQCMHSLPISMTISQLSPCIAKIDDLCNQNLWKKFSNGTSDTNRQYLLVVRNKF